MKVISDFIGANRYLSNFSNHSVTYNGYTYKNSEAAFQAQKCPERSHEFCDLSPSEAKHLGRKVKLRSDWEEVKDQIMYEIVLAKFQQNPTIKQKLIETNDAKLIEGNTWGDRYWGICNGVGKNRLGEILMRVRKEFKEES